MNPCGKKIVVIFVFLLLLVLLFVPYRETRINIYQGSASLLARRITTTSSGHMFLPRFLKLRGHWTSQATGEQRHTLLNTTLFAGEIAVLLFLAVFDHLVFCVWIRRRRSGVRTDLLP
ncbi:MAG: hypothetical protein NTU60_04615 [Candidatus Aminicenantes bacterium]|nr:hypothetical protein [Candidatus Aminicenantes bacterium]